MEKVLIIGLLILQVVTIVVLLAKSKGTGDSSLKEKLSDYEKNMRDEFERNRKELANSSLENRKETMNTLLSFQDAVGKKFDSLTQNMQVSLNQQKESSISFQESVSKKFVALTKNTNDTMTNGLTKFMSTLSERIDALTKSTQTTLNMQQDTVQKTLKSIQDSNEKKLDEMRNVVDEKLQSTLENRLTKSFELVTKQLEAVQKGLGEMQNLASDVGGLKRALTNVKTAGGIGEVQLESLLSQILSPEQFVKNSHPNPNNSRKVVEFAVKIPSKDTTAEFIYLPIDSKFPMTTWENLTISYENAEKDEIESCRKVLVTEIKKMAKDIKEKYIEVPYTTDFGIMFLPIEGLYAEVIRIPGLLQEIQTTYKVTVSGPTTLTALLNSLQMGFRTLAIQQETSKVWELLGTVKSEFGKFGTALAQTKKKLESATSEIERAEHRSRQIEKKLTKVEAISDNSSQLELDDFSDMDV